MSVNGHVHVMLYRVSPVSRLNGVVGDKRSQGGHETSYVRRSAPTSADRKPPRKAQEDDGTHWCEPVRAASVMLSVGLRQA